MGLAVAKKLWLTASVTELAGLERLPRNQARTNALGVQPNGSSYREGVVLPGVCQRHKGSSGIETEDDSGFFLKGQEKTTARTYGIYGLQPPSKAKKGEGGKS